MMITHYIYLLPGIKVGCCRDLEARKKWYPRHRIAMLKVLEELHDVTDQEAGDREWWWADKLGLTRGQHYTFVAAVVMSSAERLELHRKMDQKGGPIGGAIAGSRYVERTTPEQRAELGRKGGLRAGQLGRSGYQTRTPEQRIEIARLGGKKAMALLTPEQRVERARKAVQARWARRDKPS